MLQSPTHAPENMIEVPINFEVPFFVAHLCNWSSVQDTTRVQATDVKPAELFNREINQTFND